MRWTRLCVSIVAHRVLRNHLQLLVNSLHLSTHLCSNLDKLGLHGYAQLQFRLLDLLRHSFLDLEMLSSFYLRLLHKVSLNLGLFIQQGRDT